MRPYLNINKSLEAVPYAMPVALLFISSIPSCSVAVLYIPYA